MRFKRESDGWRIKISNVWYFLCCCVNCHEIHAYHPFRDAGMGSGLLEMDEKIKCCIKPDNHCETEGSNKILKDFVKAQKTTTKK